MTALPEARPVREEVRAAIAAWNRSVAPQCDGWLFGHDPDFTRLLAERGLIGITWPKEFGGRAGSALDRLVVTEELLRAGAPVAAHWVADRQIGPAILRYGDRKLQHEFLPRIAAGQVTFCLGMSEPESGSDLAAVRTRAIPIEDGYRITGHKLWTSNAHRSTHAYVLARVPGGTGKYDGLTEFIVDLDAPGIEVRPIYDLNGEHHFNETVFTDVFVPAGCVIGAEGGGWHQVTEQLSFERGGIERVLSTYPVLDTLLRDGLLHADHLVPAGGLAARLHALRGLAADVAAAVDAGEAPVRPAAMLKYLGTSFEGDLVEFGRVVLGRSPRPGRSAADRLVAQGILRSPGATLRGGTTEVLLNILARKAEPRPVGDELARLADEALADLDRTDKPAGMEEVWARASSLDWTAVGVAESAGGSGGNVADLATIVRALGRRGLSAPVAETALANAALARGPAASAGLDLTMPRTLATRTSLRLHRDRGQLVLTGRCDLMPWAPFAAEAVVAARDEDQHQVLVRLGLAAPGVRCQPFADLVGDPTADLEVTASPIAADDVLGGADLVRCLEVGQQALRSAAALGAMEYATRLAAEHADVRTQFGRPLRSFQAVAHHLARMEAELVLSEASLRLAVQELLRGRPGRRALAAQIQVAYSSGLVARIAHQVLGAMGMTREHPLHRATVRLWSWRDAPAAATELARELGQAMTAAGPDAFWEWLVTSTDDLEQEAGFDSWAQASSVTRPRYQAHLSDFGGRADSAGARTSPSRPPTPTPADVVRRFYAAIIEHAPDRLGELADAAFADDIAVELPPSLPYGGRVQGAGRLRRMFRAMARGSAEVGPRDLAVEAIIDGGDRVTARLSFIYRTPEGTDVPTGALEEWTFEQGRAIAIRAYYWDTAGLLSARPANTAGLRAPGGAADGGAG